MNYADLELHPLTVEPEPVTPPNLGDTPTYFTDEPHWQLIVILALAAVVVIAWSVWRG